MWTFVYLSGSPSLFPGYTCISIPLDMCAIRISTLSPSLERVSRCIDTWYSNKAQREERRQRRRKEENREDNKGVIGRGGGSPRRSLEVPRVRDESIGALLDLCFSLLFLSFVPLRFLSISLSGVVLKERDAASLSLFSPPISLPILKKNSTVKLSFFLFPSHLCFFSSSAFFLSSMSSPSAVWRGILFRMS